MIRTLLTAALALAAMLTAAVWITSWAAGVLQASLATQNSALLVTWTGGGMDVACFYLKPTASKRSWFRPSLSPETMTYRNAFELARQHQYSPAAGLPGSFYCARRIGSPFDHVVLNVGFPLWLPLLLTGTYPAMALVRGPVRRFRRRRLGLCGGCAYNLTGNTSGVCPECGRPVPKDRHRVAQTTATKRDPITVRRILLIASALASSSILVWGVVSYRHPTVSRARLSATRVLLVPASRGSIAFIVLHDASGFRLARWAASTKRGWKARPWGFGCLNLHFELRRNDIAPPRKGGPYASAVVICPLWVPWAIVSLVPTIVAASYLRHRFRPWATTD